MTKTKRSSFPCGTDVFLPGDIRAAEKKSIKSNRDEERLIEIASGHLAKLLSMRAGGGEILIVSGGGNNGNDGLFAAEKLIASGERVAVFAISSARNEINAAVMKRLESLGATFVSEIERGRYAVIADCIFGTGLNRAPDGSAADAIAAINESGAHVIAADVPSGLNAENGNVYSVAVRADETLTFIGVKTGLLLGEGRNYCGAVSVADIGVTLKPIGKITSESDAALPARKTVSHKGSYGRVAVIGGSERFVGAPLMSFESAVAASRSGAGLVTLCVPKSSISAWSSRVKETMLLPLPSRKGHIKFSRKALDGIIAANDVICFGTGAAKSKDAAKIALYLAKNFGGTLVLDADALNSLAEYGYDELQGKRARVIMTPHVVEFARLIGKRDYSLEEVKRFAAKLGCVVALKSATTIITDGEKTYFNVSGSPCLAKGGSGDVLSGIVGAFACVLDPLPAAVAACYHFGKAGERAEKRLNSEVSVLASDVIIEIERERGKI